MQHARRSPCVLVSGRTASCCLVLHVGPGADDNNISKQAGFHPNMCCIATAEAGMVCLQMLLWAAELEVLLA